MGFKASSLEELRNVSWLRLAGQGVGLHVSESEDVTSEADSRIIYFLLTEVGWWFQLSLDPSHLHVLGWPLILARPQFPYL